MLVGFPVLLSLQKNLRAFAAGCDSFLVKCRIIGGMALHPTASHSPGQINWVHAIVSKRKAILGGGRLFVISGKGSPTTECAKSEWVCAGR